MDRTKQIITVLKPKVKAFGFNQKEIKGVAAKIADNLDLKDDASDEDVNAAIETAVEAVLPILEFGRSYANRVINDSVNENRNGSGNNDDTDDDEGDNGAAASKSANSTRTKQKKSDDDVPSWAKALIESNNALKSELAAIKGEKVTDTRRSKLEKLLKDTGTFGTRTLKSFGRMKFESDDEFDEFFSEVEEDLKSLNQERANAGLGKLGAPATGGSMKRDDKNEVLSDDEIKALAKL